MHVIFDAFCTYFCDPMNAFLFPFPKTPLMRQECLEHDQRIVALVSMVRHIEVRLKQQQQQSVGRSLLALEDTIRQTEVRRGGHLPNLDPQFCSLLKRLFDGCVYFGHADGQKKSRFEN